MMTNCAQRGGQEHTDRHTPVADRRAGHLNHVITGLTARPQPTGSSRSSCGREHAEASAIDATSTARGAIRGLQVNDSRPVTGADHVRDDRTERLVQAAADPSRDGRNQFVNTPWSSNVIIRSHFHRSTASEHRHRETLDHVRDAAFARPRI